MASNNNPKKPNKKPEASARHPAAASGEKPNLSAGNGSEQPHDSDPEAIAIMTTLGALKPLNPEARQRVITYCSERFRIEGETGTGPQAYAGSNGETEERTMAAGATA